MPVTFAGAVLNATSLQSATEGFTPYALFASGEQGAWYDPSDYSTMFQDSAGNVRVTDVEQSVGLIRDKSGRGNHASQATAGARPVLSARVNLLLATATLATQSVTTVATTYTLAFSGAGSITLSGTKTGTYSAGTHSLTGVTAGTLTLTVSGTVTNADLRVSNDGVGLPAYQRVNTSTDYDTNGFPRYLRFDGSNDAIATSSINFTATNKMTVWAGVRKLSDASTGVVAELSSDFFQTNGSFIMSAPEAGGAASFGLGSRGTSVTGFAVLGYPSPTSRVLCGSVDIASPNQTLRINGSVAQTNTASMGTGNFGNHALNIGARGNGANFRFNGHLYSLIVRGAASSAGQITDAEAWVNGKTKAYA